MKPFANQSVFIAALTLVVAWPVRAQPGSPEQQQPAAPPKPSATQPSPTPPPQQPAPALHPAAAAAADRQPLLARPEPLVTTASDLSGVIHVATRGISYQTARALDGRNVRGRDDRPLGNVKDFLIDSQSGEVAYAVVSSGGFGVRNELRLVPFKALKRDHNHKDEYAVSMDEAEWKGLGALDRKEFESGVLTVADGDRRDLEKRFDRAQSDEAVRASAFYTRDISVHLVRAGHIRGSAVFLGGKKIGTIEEVIMGEGAATASALFEPSSRLTNAKAKFVVPLNRYSFGTTKDERITATITRVDFEQMEKITHDASTPAPTSPGPQMARPAPAAGTASAPPAGTGAKAPATPAAAQSSAPAASKTANAYQKAVAAKQASAGAPSPAKAPAAAPTGSAPPQNAEPELTPTGRTVADQKAAAPAAGSLSAVKAIRAALDQEAAAIARIGVEVNPENGNIVLRGSVTDESLKKSIEEKAAQAAQGAKIDSQIAIENRTAGRRSNDTPPAKSPAPTAQPPRENTPR